MGVSEKRRNDCQPNEARASTGLAKWLLLLLLLIAAYMLIKSHFFVVGTVIVEGNHYLSQEDVYQTAGVPEKINIFRLSTSEIKARMLKDLRIEQADVSRRFPATIVINITERHPLAYVASAYGFAQLDRQGVVLAAMKNIKQMGIPIITGIGLGNVYIGEKADAPGLQNALVYMAALDDATLGQLSEINIKPSGELTAYTIHAITIRLGGGDRLVEKAQFTCDVLQDIGARKAAVEYIDLNYASPYIKFKKQPQQQQ